MRSAGRGTTDPTTSGLWPLIWATYALAATNYAVNHLPWGLFPADFLMAINKSAWLTGTASFLLWCAVAGFAAWRYRRRAWPILVGAPLALATFIGVVSYIVVSAMAPH